MRPWGTNYIAVLSHRIITAEFNFRIILGSAQLLRFIEDFKGNFKGCAQLVSADVPVLWS